MDFLLKNGSKKWLFEFKDGIYHLKMLQDYSCYEDSVDRGEGVREKTKQIIELLNDEKRLEEERESARKIREKLTGVSGIGSNQESSAYAGMAYNDSKKPVYDTKSHGHSWDTQTYDSGFEQGGGMIDKIKKKEEKHHDK